MGDKEDLITRGQGMVGPPSVGAGRAMGGSWKEAELVG
jgi:hypothetical protein